MIRTMATALVVVLMAAGSLPAQAAGSCQPPPSAEPAALPVRTDQQATGNRVARGCGPMDGSLLDLQLGARPAWVLPDPSMPGDAWLVALEGGAVVRISTSRGDGTKGQPEVLAQLAPGEPPQAQSRPDGELVVSTALDADGWFEDPTAETRVVQAPDGSLLALTEPTARYPHGAVGDELEAAAIGIRDADGRLRRIGVSHDSVIEGTSALLAELRGDGGQPEIVVTVSDADEGARLVVYGLEGEQIAASEAIGQGFRWLHQLGVGPLGPDGEVEIIAVRTPHIGGIVEAYRLVEGRLELVAREPGFSSHRLGSLNLDMAVLADTDGDGRLEVVVPTGDFSGFGVLARTDQGFEPLGLLPLEGRLATNVAATADEDGRLVLAAGTEDGRLRIFR